MKFSIFLIMFLLPFGNYLTGQEKSIPLENSIFQYGGIVRFDTTKKIILLTFTGGEYREGTGVVRNCLKTQNILANFFFTGDFYRERSNRKVIRQLKKDGHYLGPHSDKHLLYADWTRRDSLLVNSVEFSQDLLSNYDAMEEFGIHREDASFFMPPFEWYNDSISIWTKKLGFKLVNYTQGTRSNADYTTPDMDVRYVDSETIMQSILHFERESGLNGFILLLHVGTDPGRTDKFYSRLDELISELRRRGYRFLSLKSVDLNSSS
ncbi:MAG: polysaccharide deacetylase family protein [Saprospiraceae bacterium]|nr:polysaccharide deacetylase family protein [Saprospiraceae bacterium]